MKKVSILNMAEDLIDEDLACNIDKNQTAISKDSGSKKSKSSKYSSLEDLIADLAKILEMPVEELDDWINEVLIPESALKTILITAKHLELNPVLGHIAWERNQEGGYELYIPIDGWIAMIHREPSFQGMAFSQSEDTENGVPIWMECTIYRANLIHPVTVREYYAELKTEHPIWQHMPCRMLRHKTLHQCIRLAFGISAPEFEKPLVTTNSIQPIQNQSTLRTKAPKDYLRQKLSK